MNFVAGPQVLAWLTVVACIAGMAKGLTGFGGALVMAPLFGTLIDVPDAGALVVLIHCATSMQGARNWRHAVRWKSVAPLAGVAIVFTAITSRFVADGNAVFLRHAVATAVLGITGLHVAGWRWRHDAGWTPTFSAGIISGVLTALAGLGGPPAVYYFAAHHKGLALRANLLGYFAILFGGAIILLVADHRIRAPQIWTAALLIPAFGVGVHCGECIGPRLPSRWFDHAVIGLLLGSGVIALIT
ncbi:sulfite exporter TauE/SafE family protein [Caballeronia sordidicola]|uniref:Probable membrane transporter protein n=1 Tax=Caballeronia sordidicola TaxID=196367 RepID=A0A242N4U1_CABSO|nr:sulfite exporter TauE/SafE family protein [Caballeronia sordidicola]OTP78424.1 hypothetical protein PAMC26577_05000 [Caballeronia sordidicola]